MFFSVIIHAFLFLWPMDAMSASSIEIQRWPKTERGHEWALVRWFNTSEKIWHRLPSPPLQSVFNSSDEEKFWKAVGLRQVKYDSQCPPNMRWIHGQMRSIDDSVQRQNAACLDGASWKPGFLCQHFDEARLKPDSSTHQSMSFCMDVYEFPNILGEYPATLVSFSGAKKICQAQGKRLCREEEWIFACEGEEAWPYPQGYDRYIERDAHFPDHIPQGAGCNVDHLKLPMVNANRLLNAPYSQAALIELDRTWLGTYAGERSECESSFSIFDMMGNIEEWVEGTLEGHGSTLKGGYWAPVQARCQMAERAHGPTHRYYQTGFRCCSNEQL